MIRDIVLQDLGFDEVQLLDFSTQGIPYLRKGFAGMPRIDHGLLDSVFFLYESRADADAGLNPKGTGFIVSYNLPLYFPSWQIYGVTNRHVIQHGFSVIRVNTVDGAPDVFDYDPADWDCDETEDIAVISLDQLNPKKHQITSNPISDFATQQDIELGEIGVGEDVFMLGLFIDHHGETKNIPKARFGNISMLANKDAPIITNIGMGEYRSESHVIDMHSRSGFSGSPVYTYRTIGSDLTNPKTGHGKIDSRSLESAVGEAIKRGRITNRPIEIELYEKPMFRFLGIHYAQFPESFRVKEMVGSATPQMQQYLEGMSGMTCVCPSWKIRELLDLPKFAEKRNAKALIREKPPTGKPHLESNKNKS